MGSNLNTWLEAIIIFIGVIGIVGVIVSGMNGLYSKNNVTPFSDRTDSIMNDLTQYQNATAKNVYSGTPTFLGSLGLSLSTSWSMLTGAFGIITDFLTGNIIRDTCNYLGFPAFIGVLLQLLYFFAIGFIILKILFRINI